MNKEVESVRETYNRDEMVKTYSDAVDKVGLWDSEKSNLIEESIIDFRN